LLAIAADSAATNFRLRTATSKRGTTEKAHTSATNIAPPPADARAAARKTEPAAAKLGRDSFLSGQNEKCYWSGQCDIIDDENTRLHD